MRHLHFLGVPESEEKVAFDLTVRLIDVGRLVTRFDHALFLYHLCVSQLRIPPSLPKAVPEAEPAFASRDKLMSWADIAKRDCAMTIFDFGKALALVRNALNQTLTVKELVDWRELEVVLADFHKSFPNARPIRNAAGHPVDVAGTPKRNAFTGDYQGQYMAIKNSKNLMLNVTDGNTTVVTIENKILSFELSEKSAAILRGISERALDLFEPAAQNLQAAFIEKQKSNMAQPE